MAQAAFPALKYREKMMKKISCVRGLQIFSLDTSVHHDGNFPKCQLIDASTRMHEILTTLRCALFM